MKNWQIKFLPFSVVFIVYWHYTASYLYPLITGTYEYEHIDSKLPLFFRGIDILESFPLYLIPFENQDTKKGLNLLIGFNFLFILALYSLVKTKLTNPGRVPLEYSKEQEEIISKGLINRDEKLQKKLQGVLNLNDLKSKNDAKKVIYALISSGLFCIKCNIYKPPRSQHCLNCKQCVLKHEYHFPFLNTCIGYNNLKYFLLANFYFTLAFSFMSVTYFKCFLESWVYKISNFQSAQNTLFLLGSSCMIIIFAYFLLLHYILISKNQTCSERLQNKQSKYYPYDFGFYYNFTQIFGKNPYLWLVPVKHKKSKGKGLTFKEKEEQKNE